jgi:hypothetical protein
MTEASIIQYISETYAGVEILVGSKESGSPEIAWGDSFFYYGPDRMLPFATIVTKDYGDFDCASNLNRPGVFRLNIGVSKDTFRSLFGPKLSASEPADVAEPAHDFTSLDRLMPHPVYAPQSWVCVLNPSEETFETVRPLLAEAYDLAVKRAAKREAHA